MFAMEHFGVEPDVIALAKGIASGMPLGAMIARADVMDWTPDRMRRPSEGIPFPVARPWLPSIFSKKGLIENARMQGRTARWPGLFEIQKR